MNNNIKIEIHLLQNFVPSCINRDDSNTPKDCEFGGVRRARISSQCIKRSIREMMTEKCIKTKYLKKHLLELLDKEGVNGEDIESIVELFIESCFQEFEKDKTKTKTKIKTKTNILLPVSEEEIKESINCISELIKMENIKEIIKEYKKSSEKDDETEKGKKGNKKKDLIESKEYIERLKKAKITGDIALFGRMITGKDMNVNAACQVAHAISTHRVDLEMDFYTAVDDLNREGEQGAGMIGVTGYNSACFYRYSLLDRKQLITNFAGDEKTADNIIREFLEASVKAIPTGKQNTFAAQNLPLLGMFIVKKDGMPCSLANAFVKPVFARNEKDDLVEKSIKTLTQHYENLIGVYGNMGEVTKSVFHIGYEESLGAFVNDSKKTLQEAIEAVMEGIKKASVEE
jgi:CRISPR system Cascade subunit CasC